MHAVTLGGTCTRMPRDQMRLESVCACVEYARRVPPPSLIRLTVGISGLTGYITHQYPRQGGAGSYCWGLLVPECLPNQLQKSITTHNHGKNKMALKSALLDASSQLIRALLIFRVVVELSGR